MAKKLEDGVFYTPDYLAEYIVQRTLLLYLRKSNNTETFEQLINERRPLVKIIIANLLKTL